LRIYRREREAGGRFHVFVIAKVWKRPAKLPKASLTACSRQCQNAEHIEATEGHHDCY